MTTAEVPGDLREKVTEGLAANSKLPWDWVVTDIAEANATEKPE
jgi:hypothetical protein